MPLILPCPMEKRQEEFRNSLAACKSTRRRGTSAACSAGGSLAVFLLGALGLHLLLVLTALVLRLLLLLVFPVVLHKNTSFHFLCGLVFPEDAEYIPEICEKKEKLLLTSRDSPDILNQQNKEGCLHPPHLPPSAKRSTSLLSNCPAGGLLLRGCRFWYPRFVILEWRCFDHS